MKASRALLGREMGQRPYMGRLCHKLKRAYHLIFSPHYAPSRWMKFFDVEEESGGVMRLSLGGIQPKLRSFYGV